MCPWNALGTNMPAGLAGLNTILMGHPSAYLRVIYDSNDHAFADKQQ